MAWSWSTLSFSFDDGKDHRAERNSSECRINTRYSRSITHHFAESYIERSAAAKRAASFYTAVPAGIIRHMCRGTLDYMAHEMLDPKLQCVSASTDVCR